jgi:hypothetical protein
MLAVGMGVVGVGRRDVGLQLQKTIYFDVLLSIIGTLLPKPNTMPLVDDRLLRVGLPNSPSTT